MINSKKKLGIAILGLGSYSTTQLAPSIDLSEHCELRGIITGTPVKASMWKRKYQLTESSIYNYENFDNISNDPSIDIVFITTPNATHKEYVCRAAEAKKHVVCEKPLGVNINDCNEMIAACKKNGVKLSVGYRLCYDPYFNYLNKSFFNIESEIKISGSLGFQMRDESNWRLKKNKSGGGALIDIGIYGIYTTCYILNARPDSVRASINSKVSHPFKEVEESATFNLYFGHSSATFSCSYITPSNWLKLKTANEEIVLNNAFSASGQQMNSSTKIHFDKVCQIAIHLDDFAQSVMYDTEAKVTGALGLRDGYIIDALYESARTGINVNVNYD